MESLQAERIEGEWGVVSLRFSVMNMMNDLTEKLLLSSLASQKTKPPSKGYASIALMPIHMSPMNHGTMMTQGDRKFCCFLLVKDNILLQLPAVSTGSTLNK